MIRASGQRARAVTIDIPGSDGNYVTIRADDLLEVRSRFLEVGGASLTAEQVISRETTELAHLDVRLACMTGGGRPSRIPNPLREALQTYRGDTVTDTDNEPTERRD